MHGQNHSYLDLSVLKELRHCIISNDAVVLFNEDVDQIIWANAAGAKLFGGRGVVDLLATRITESQSVVSQLKKAISTMGKTRSIVRGVRVSQGLRSLLIQFEIRKIMLPDGDTGYKVTNHSKETQTLNDNTLARNAVETLTGFADASAIIDDDGKVIAQSENFGELGPDHDSLVRLVDELKSEDDRLIKRAELAVNQNAIAIGLARISGKPARNLIVVAQTQAEDEETSNFEDDGNIQTENAEPLPLHTPEPDIASQADNLEEPYSEAINENASQEDIASQEPAAREEKNEIASPTGLEDHKPQQRFDFEKNDGTVRFAWVIDEKCVFKSVSPELAETVGENAASVSGREWREVANVFGFDTNHEIENLLKKQDTWSGKTVLWPVQGTDMVLPIDLAALPSFNSNREFEGFRGFGIIRTADAIVDPDETGMALTSAIQEELPADVQVDIEEQDKTASIEMKPASEKNETSDYEPGESSSNIVRLVPREMQPVVPTLSEQENTAFRKIGNTLRNKADNTENKNNTTSSELTSETQPTLPEPREKPSGKDAKIEAFRPARLDTSIMESLPVAIVIYNSEEILFTNQSFLNATQYRDTSELEAAGGIETILVSHETQEKSGAYSLKTKNGNYKPINPVLHTVPWGGQKALLISFATTEIDMHAEPPALEMSSISEIQNILDITSDGILVMEPTGEIVSINASAEALFNMGFDDAKNRDITTLFASESRNSVRQYIENVTGPGVGQLFDDGQEVIAAEANGGMIPVFLTISKMQSSGKLCAVIRDMTSWKKAEEELIQSRHEAENASSHKTDFLANISHEIRTPLNSIIGFSEVMIEERFGSIKNDRYREYLRDINRSGNHILDLINDLLDLSKIEAGKLELEFEAVNLNEVVSETVALLQPQANDNRIIIRTSLSRSVPKVVADTRSIRQIILNLVSNAIKFSPTNSQVIVSTVYESNGEVALRIRDTGRGMNPSEIEEALQPFQQILTDDEERKGGTGLGLPLTKALVEANRALFDLESEPGQGTIAHVQFPTQRVLAD